VAGVNSRYETSREFVALYRDGNGAEGRRGEA